MGDIRLLQMTIITDRDGIFGQQRGIVSAMDHVTAPAVSGSARGENLIMSRGQVQVPLVGMTFEAEILSPCRQ